MCIPYDPLNTCPHLASSAPLLFPVLVFWAPVSFPCSTVSHLSFLFSDVPSPKGKLNPYKQYTYIYTDLQSEEQKRKEKRNAFRITMCFLVLCTALLNEWIYNFIFMSGHLHGQFLMKLFSHKQTAHDVPRDAQQNNKHKHNPTNTWV